MAQSLMFNYSNMSLPLLPTEVIIITTCKTCSSVDPHLSAGTYYRLFLHQLSTTRYRTK